MKKNVDCVLVFILALFPVIIGTTYIIKEGNTEVGRYVENDGSTETKVIQNEPPVNLPQSSSRTAPASVSALDESTSSRTGSVIGVENKEDRLKSQPKDKGSFKSGLKIVLFLILGLVALGWIRRKMRP